MAIKILLTFRCTPAIKKAVEHRANEVGMTRSMFLSTLLETPGVLSLVQKHKDHEHENHRAKRA